MTAMSDSNRLEIPGHVTLSEGPGGLSRVLVETPCSSAEIYLHGAHVTRFQKKSGEPLLFMSAASDYSPGKPIRGGVPVIFPWFGAREGLPAHGFARTVAWDLLESTLLPDGAVTLRFRLPPVEFYDVEYLVTVADTLTLELVVGNTGSLQAVFETCLHTYFQVAAAEAISITGLEHAGYLDKIEGTKEPGSPDPIRIAAEVDRVYPDTTATVEIHDPGLQRVIRIAKSGSASTVVWNPWIAKSSRMSDFGDDEFTEMVCVESGNVGPNAITLPPGERTALKVVVGSGELG